MIYKEIGRKIQRAREEAGLSQEALASRLGLTQAALSNYELGKRGLHIANLQRIAEVLDRPLSYFLEETRKPADAVEDERLDKSISEMISLWYDMPESEREYLLDYIKWRRNQYR